MNGRGHSGVATQHDRRPFARLHLFAQFTQAPLSLGGPIATRIHTEVVLPVTNGFVIGMHPFQGDGSIKQGDGIVGLFCKDPAEELYGLSVVDCAVYCRGALAVGCSEISKQLAGNPDERPAGGRRSESPHHNVPPRAQPGR